MSFTKSLVMVVPSARRVVCNALMEAVGRGPDTFSVPLRLIGNGAINSYGAHSYDDALATAIETLTLPPGVLLAQLQAYGFTVATAKTAVGYIRYKVTANHEAVTNFITRLNEDGIERIPAGII